MRTSFEVTVEKEQLIFSAAHFITFGDNICESIHGHNYRVRCKVAGLLANHAYVVDFIALRDELLKVTREWDHHVLLPTQHPTIQVQVEDQEVTARFQDRRWVFPKSDCVLLDIDNTTAERLAEVIAGRIVSEFLEPKSIDWSSITVGVDENEGQWADCRMEKS